MSLYLKVFYWKLKKSFQAVRKKGNIMQIVRPARKRSPMKTMIVILVMRLSMDCTGIDAMILSLQYRLYLSSFWAREFILLGPCSPANWCIVMLIHHLYSRLAFSMGLLRVYFSIFEIFSETRGFYFKCRSDGADNAVVWNWRMFRFSSARHVLLFINSFPHEVFSQILQCGESHSTSLFVKRLVITLVRCFHGLGDMDVRVITEDVKTNSFVGSSRFCYTDRFESALQFFSQSSPRDVS